MSNGYISSAMIEHERNIIDNSTDPNQKWSVDDVYYYFGCVYTKRSIKAWGKENVLKNDFYSDLWDKSDIERFRKEAPFFCNDFEIKYKERKIKDEEIIQGRKSTFEVYLEMRKEYPHVLQSYICSLGRSLNVYKTCGNKFMWSKEDIEKLRHELNKKNIIKSSYSDTEKDLSNRKSTIEVEYEIFKQFKHSNVNSIRKFGHDNNVSKEFNHTYIWTESDLERLKNDFKQKELEKEQRDIYTLSTAVFAFVLIFSILVFIISQFF